jgi:hypothetical protein
MKADKKLSSQPAEGISHPAELNPHQSSEIGGLP